VLVVVSAIDLGAVAAAWNVRHAREIDGQGAQLDLCYLDSLNGAALVSLVELEQRAADPALKDRVAAVRARQMATMQAHQAEWRGWRWRDARRLDRVARLTAGEPWTEPLPGLRDCDGDIIPASVTAPAFAPASPAPIAAPLTSEAGA